MSGINEVSSVPLVGAGAYVVLEIALGYDASLSGGPMPPLGMGDDPDARHY